MLDGSRASKWADTNLCVPNRLCSAVDNWCLIAVIIEGKPGQRLVTLQFRHLSPGAPKDQLYQRGGNDWRTVVPFEGGFTFTNFVADAFAVFMFILWFWLLVTVSSDLFRRHDVSGFGKVLWVILLILLPYIGIFAYILTKGRGMAERNKEQAKLAREHLRQAVGFSVADEIEKLDRLKSTKSISDEEYTRLRAQLVQ